MAKGGEQSGSEARAEAPALTPEVTKRALTAVVAAWLVPGLGHVLLGRWIRGICLGLLLLFMFAVGLLLEGSLSKPVGGSYLSALAALADMGMGPVYFLAHSLDWGVGTPTSATHEVGNTFHWSAGVMNMLLMLDAWDVATGRK